MLLVLFLTVGLNADIKDLFVGPVRLGQGLTEIKEALGAAPVEHLCKRGPGGDQNCVWVANWSDRDATAHLVFTDEKTPELQQVVLTNRPSPSSTPFAKGVPPIDEWKWFGGLVFSFPNSVKGWAPDKLTPSDNFQGKAFFSPSGLAIAWVSCLSHGKVEFSIGWGN